ncbi:bactericidal permeability-increasing protein [Erpetoichthys calabaricus]|uniref:bactericidal permeability-increasing protein n=1 Tax=Erpetoichthys calabaricus TaxID=27687 RepID=UPI00223457ED|nr:bactericidal permeability-increasing protein [Erpetoichthys calabaricus]
MRKLWQVVFLISLISTITSGTNPGMKGLVTQRAIDYAIQVGKDIAQRELQSLDIPDVSGSASIDPIGNVYYELQGMRITSFSLSDPVVLFDEGVGMQIGIDVLDIETSGYWHVKYLFISDSGSFDLMAKNIVLSVVVQIGMDSTGRLSLACVSCDSSVGDLGITFHGGASWLYNLFSDTIDQRIREELDRKLCPTVNEKINDFESQLQRMKVTFQLDPAVVLEFPLINPPLIQNTSLELDIKGEWYSTAHHQEPPFTPCPFKLPVENNFMLYFGLSAFSVNSAAFAYFSAGVLKLYVTDEMVPKSSPIRLTTNSFGMFIPELPKRYPNMSMEILLLAREPPLTKVQADNITESVFGIAKMFVVLPNKTLAPAFALEINSSFKIDLSVSGQKLCGSIQLTSFNLSLSSSEIGPFQTTSMEKIFRLGLQIAVLPKVNEKLKSGFPIPEFKGIALVNPLLRVNQGFLMFATDVKYRSQSAAE